MTTATARRAGRTPPSRAATDAPATPGGSSIIWAVLSIVVDVLWIKLVGPHVPAGAMTDTADGAAFDFNVLIVIALPV